MAAHANDAWAGGPSGPEPVVRAPCHAVGGTLIRISCKPAFSPIWYSLRRYNQGIGPAFVVLDTVALAPRPSRCACAGRDDPFVTLSTTIGFSTIVPGAIRITVVAARGPLEQLNVSFSYRIERFHRRATSTNSSTSTVRRQSSSSCRRKIVGDRTTSRRGDTVP